MSDDTEVEALIAQLRRALTGAMKEARRWKDAHAHLAAQPSPGAYDLGKQLAATRCLVQSAIAQKNSAIDAQRKATAFKFGMDQRCHGRTLAQVKRIDPRAAVSEGWVYMDNAIAKEKT